MVDSSKLWEFRWHGRGGQGAWTASELLARTAFITSCNCRGDTYNIQSFPEFGPERMGAPVTAFTRISGEHIRIRCAVYEPDVVIVLDSTLLKSVFVTAGLKEGGHLIVNSKESAEKLAKILEVPKGRTVWTVKATELAMDSLRKPVTNTAMLSVVAKATGLVSLEDIEKTLRNRFNPDLAEKNIAVVKEAYEKCDSFFVVETSSLENSASIHSVTEQKENWTGLPIAAVSPKQSTDFLTGDWKTFKPVVNLEKCVACLTCAIFCPEGAVHWNSELGKVEFTLEKKFCKGCGVCANECPQKAITMELSARDE